MSNWESRSPIWHGFKPENGLLINWRDWEVTSARSVERQFCIAPLDERNPRHNHVHMKDVVKAEADINFWRDKVGDGWSDKLANARLSSVIVRRKLSVDRVICSIKENGKHSLSRREILGKIETATGGELVLPWRGDAKEFGWGYHHPDYKERQQFIRKRL